MESTYSSVLEMTDAREVLGWNVFHDSVAASSPDVSRVERPNLERTLGWKIYHARSHASWAKVAVVRVSARKSSETFSPSPASSATSSTTAAGVKYDLSDSRTMARATIDMATLWQCCGVGHLAPDLKRSGDLAITHVDILLQQHARSGGVMRGVCDTKPYAQIFGSGWTASTFTCADQCLRSDCAACQFGLYLSCARSTHAVAVQCTASEGATEVEMTFRISPTSILADSDFRTINRWSFRSFGVFRDARRANFSSQRALASMFHAERNTAFRAFMERVVRLGWHDRVKALLSSKGMTSAPYEHQSAAILAMLEMERTSCHPLDYDSEGGCNAPRFGRGGASKFLKESMSEMTDTEYVCSLTGAVVSKRRYEEALGSLRGGLLALPPGVGKTYTCVALAVATWTPGQTTVSGVIRTPTHLSLQWKREISRFCPCANVIDADEDGVDITPEVVRSGTGPTFVVLSGGAHSHAFGIACRGGSESEGFSRDVAGVSVARTFIDEAHELDASPMAPGADEAVWAVTATPFFSDSSCRDGLYSVLQKVPRHFGLPRCHGQLLNLFNKDAGTLYNALTLNLYELQDMLPEVHSRAETIVVARNRNAFATLATRIIEHAGRQRASWATSRTGHDAFVRSANATIRRAALRGLVVHMDELFERTGLHFYDFGMMHSVYERPRFPALESIPFQESSARVAQRLETPDDCVVCLDALEDSLIAMPCDHVMHYECLRNWYRTDNEFLAADGTSQSRCATCRTQYSVTQLRRVTRGDRRLGDATGCGGGNGSRYASAAGSVSAAEDPNKWTFDEVHVRAVELIREHLRKREGKAIVFLCQHSAVRLHSFLRDADIAFVNCIEAGSDQSRARAIEEFVNGPPEVLLIDPKSETGLNLTVANFVLNYAGHRGSWDQLVGRVRRLGQVHDVRVVQLDVDTANLVAAARAIA